MSATLPPQANVYISNLLQLSVTYQGTADCFCYHCAMRRCHTATVMKVCSNIRQTCENQAEDSGCMFPSRDLQPHLTTWILLCSIMNSSSSGINAGQALMFNFLRLYKDPRDVGNSDSCFAVSKLSSSRFGSFWKQKESCSKLCRRVQMARER